ncbi:MAG: putative phage abortive infection protein [Chthoniobacterales bacterium]
MICILLFLLTIAYYPIAHAIQPKEERLGQFGDTFGALNSLISGLAFLGVLYSLALQQKEIQQSVDDTKILIAREEKRAFEETFFNLLKVFNNLVANLPDHGSSLTWIATDMENLVRHSILTTPSLIADREKLLHSIQLNYDKLFRDHENVLGQYFSMAYHMFRFIHREKAINAYTKKTYADIFRAQLSIPELTLLFFNGLHPQGENFKDLIPRYAILKHIKHQADKWKLTDLYPDSAYIDTEACEDDN